jgi:hypothetical protein
MGDRPGCGQRHPYLTRVSTDGHTDTIRGIIMTSRNAYSSKGRVLLWAIITGIAAALGYLVAELFSQHDLSFAPWGMIGIFAVLTLFTYLINVRNVPRE